MQSIRQQSPEEEKYSSITTDIKKFEAEHKKHVKGILSSDKIDANTFFLIRIIASLFMLLLIAYNLVPFKHLDVLKKDECMRDQTFIFTNYTNTWFGDHEDINKHSIILASFLMDFMQLSF